MEKAGFKLPLLIGGATTSKMHTAVKLAPQYSGAVVHVLDASRSVPVAQALLDNKRRADFVDDTREQYAEMREQFYAGLEDRRYLDLKARRVLEVAPARRPSLVGALLGSRRRALDRV